MKALKQKFNQHGVTLIETIVALGILVIGIVSAVALMLNTLNFSRNSEKTIVVVNLAREGLEMVRSIRDLNRSLSETGEGLADLGVGAKIVDANYLTGELELSAASFSSGSEIKNCLNCTLKLYNKRYYHSAPEGESTTETIFKRMITISEVSANEKKIISEVYWSEKGLEHIFRLEDHLTNW